MNAWLLAVLAVSLPAWSAQPVAFPSLDSAAQLAGHWFPVVSDAPRPAVVVLHGCGGALDDRGQLPAGTRREAGDFNAEGLHYLVLDSFSPRGLRSICEIHASQRTVREEDRRDDVQAALRWLAAQPGVDAGRIALLGRSHGGSTVLAAMDASNDKVAGQSVKPRAAVALYPGCGPHEREPRYRLAAPLLLLAGELDDWTPSVSCVRLRERLRFTSSGPLLSLTVFPGAHHGFDSRSPVRVRDNLPNTRAGKATVGGHPPAREAARRAVFDFLARELGVTLRFSHEARFHAHREAVPAPTGFAPADDVSRVPLRDAGRDRYRHYLSLPTPKAFAITERGGWFMASDDPDAMREVRARCAVAGVRCWFYAVDDQVVWADDPSRRATADGAPRGTK
jgi:dienelactone hydrolase